MLLVALIELDERTVWEMLRPQRRDLNKQPENARTIACIICDLIVGPEAVGQRCPRCKARIHVRKPGSIQTQHWPS